MEAEEHHAGGKHARLVPVHVGVECEGLAEVVSDGLDVCEEFKGLIRAEHLLLHEQLEQPAVKQDVVESARRLDFLVARLSNRRLFFKEMKLGVLAEA